MRAAYYFLFCFVLFFNRAAVLAQTCPPPGFPNSGNTCPQAPILCENLDGYCNTINNNNVPQSYPGCPGWQLNNDEWFAFYAGSTEIVIEVTPSNCSPGGMQGLQASIYSGCGPPWTGLAMDQQCSCTEDSFILESDDYVIGQIYWFVLDGCAGNVCDYSIDVLEGSTVGQPPADPGPISGPIEVCQGTSSTYSITPPLGATIYNWTLVPAIGSLNVNNNNVTINWNSGNTTGAQLCVDVENACYSNPTQSCIDIDVIPTPTATISGSGIVCAGSGGSVNLTVTFTGEGPWTFIYRINGVPQAPITTSDNPYILTVTQPGTYTLQSVSTASPTCTGTVSGTATVTQNNLGSTVTVTNATCGQSNGAVNLTPTGGNSPYTYVWSGGETTQDLSNVLAGTYTVTITDEDGCTATQTATVNDNMVNLNVTGTVVANTTCIGGNGSINITVNPGGTYTYNWSNGATTEDISNLPAGTYSVTVTQGVTCTGTASFTVPDNPNTPNLNATTTQSTCDLSNGSINLTASGGVAPYTFSWSNGATTEDLANIPAGSYTVTVTGANGCTNTASFTVNNNNPPINITATVNANTTCNGNFNGSINVTVNPAGSYTYSWSNGPTTEDQSNLPPGTYTITVSAGGTCIQTADFTIPDNPNEPNANATTTQSTCDLTNGSINLTPSGGVAPYTFSWSNGATTEDLANVLAGDYTVTITGANGCTQTATFTVGNNNPPINVTATTSPNTVCNGNFNGSINVTVNPAGTYTYEWSNGATTQDIGNVGPGTYTVTVSAGGTCTQVADFTVPDQSNTPVLAGTTVQSTCDLTNGSINLTVSGGVAPYTFSWSNGATTEDLANVLAGDYTVTVTGANGCTNTENFTINNNNPPINVTASTNPNTTCNGNFNGSINVSVSPAGTYTYEWSNGATTQDIGNVGPGTYTVTVSAGGTCTEVADFTVPDNPNEPNLVVTAVSSTCDQNNGSANLTASGGVPPYTFSWSNGATTEDLNNIPAGDYIVTVTGANGCTNVEGVTVPNNNPPINVNANIIANTSCSANGNGSIDVSVSPAGSYTYNWSSGQTTQDLTGLLPGTYTITVTTGVSCIEVADFTVPDNPNDPNLSAIETPSVCELSNGSINLTVTGGVTPYTYAWSNGATTQDISGVPSGGYLVTVTGANGCTSVGDYIVDNNNPPISVTASINPNTTCNGGNGSINVSVAPAFAYTYSWSSGPTTQDLNGLPPGDYTITVSSQGACSEVASFTVPDDPNNPELFFAAYDASCGLNNGSINLSVSGGVPTYTYNWSSGQTTQDLNNLPADIYSVTVTGANGCTGTEGVVVNDNMIPISIGAFVNNQTSCLTNNGSITLILSPANLSISWSNGGSGLTQNNLEPGDYDVTVSAGGTCTETSTITVYDDTEYPNLSPAVTSATCGVANGSVDLTVSGSVAPYTYSWSNGPSTQDIANLPPGNYAVTVTSATGCSSQINLTVPNNNFPIDIFGTIGDNVSCATPTGNITLNITPPGAYNYQWSSGQNVANLNNLAPGNYTVTVTQGVTCSAVSTFTVGNNANPPNVSASGSPATCGLPNGAVNLTASGGTGPYTFTWSNGLNTEDLNNLIPGNYTVTVSGANSCTATTTAAVVNNNIALNIAGTPQENTSCTTSNGAVNITVTPAGTYTYAWSSGATTEDLNNLAAGTYTVTASAGTCVSTATFVVTNNTPNPALDPAVTPTICGLSNGGIDLTVSGAPTPYVFVWSNAATSEDLVNVLSGNYTVTVTAANGCTATSTLNVPNNASTFAVTGAAQPLTSCTANNGSIDLTITPAGPYTILWSNGLSTEDLSGLAPGTYSVSVTETGNCTATASFFITDATTFPLTTQTVAPEICGLSNGSIDLGVSGGATPYTFAWSGSGGQSTEDLNNVPAGVYTVTVTGANGCSTTASATIPDNSIGFSLAGTALPNTSCVQNNGSIDLNVTPAGPVYTFTWSNGTLTEDVNGVAPGAYTVTVSAGGTCTNTANFTIGSNIPPPLITESVTSAFCGQSSGVIDLTISGGQAPYTYLWTGGAVTEDLNAVAPGDYAVTVTGANGCTAAETYTVPENIVIPAINGAVTPNTACGTVNGAISLSVAPVITYTYVWSGGQTTPDLGAIAPGAYTVTVSGGGSCIATATFAVPNNTAAPTVGGSTTDVLCFGENTGSISLNVNGGLAPYNYNWSPNLPGNPTNPTGLAAGTYTVTVSDALDCANTATFTVDQPAASVGLTCAATATVSAPGATDGAGTVTLSGGVPPYVLDWSPGGAPSNQVPGTVALNSLAQGSYNVTITDANGCPAYCDFTVGLVDCETAVGALSNSLLSHCGEGCLSADYSALGQFLDPDDVLQFILHEGAGNQIVNEIARNSQPDFCFNAATMNYGTTYYISAAAGDNDGNGNVLLSDYCTVVSLGTPIVFYEKPVATAVAPDPLSCAVGQVNLTGISSLPGSSFAWSTSTGQIIGSAGQPAATAGAAGTYTLIVTINGCADTAAVEVLDISNQPQAAIFASPDDILDCTIDEIILSGIAEGSLTINTIWIGNGAVYPTGTILPVDTPGFYQFIVLDTVTFCTDTASITIGEDLAYPPLFLNPPGQLTCVNNTVTLSGGSPIGGISFQWATINGTDTTILGTGPSFVTTIPGTYYLIGFDPVNHCDNALSAVVDADTDPPTAEAGAGFSLYCYGETGVLDGSGSTGQPGLGFFWSTSDGQIASGAATPTPTIAEPGTYLLLVTNPGNGCQDTDEVVIPPLAPVATATVQQPPCYGDRGAILIDSVVGAEPPILYSLDNGQNTTTQSLFTQLDAGTYTVLITDANGCSTTVEATVDAADEFIIFVEPEIVIDLGDSILIETQINVPLADISSVSWTPVTGLSCDTCLNVWAQPFNTTRYEVVVTTEAGCDDRALVLVRVQDVSVYVPNVISPNGDGVNDFFTVFADPQGVTEIASLQVYSRWGEQVYINEHFQPNNPAVGWDGRYRGAEMNPGVFVWYAVVVFIDGRELLLKGDVTVER